MAVAEWGLMTPEDKVAFGNQVKKEEEQASFPPPLSPCGPQICRAQRWHSLLAPFWLDNSAHRSSVQPVFPRGKESSSR